MALWHWILGGVAAYLISSKTKFGASGSVPTPAPTATTETDPSTGETVQVTTNYTLMPETAEITAARTTIVESLNAKGATTGGRSYMVADIGFFFGEESTADGTILKRYAVVIDDSGELGRQDISGGGNGRGNVSYSPGSRFQSICLELG